jgi:hypothetical protein
MSVARRWSDLSPVELEVELAKAGVTAKELVRDAQDVPELKPIMKRLKSRDAKLRLAVEWFGDEGHPQPKERQRRVMFYGGPEAIVYYDPSPDWGQLPGLADESEAYEVAPEGTDRTAGGRPYKKHPGLALKDAARMIANGETNKSAIARSATAKARGRIEATELVEKKWESGFSARDDVDALLEAVGERLLIWTPKALRVRETKPGVFRDVDDFEWLEIPRAK